MIANNFLIITIVLGIALFSSCKKIHKVYDDDGNLIYSNETINDSTNKKTYYYKNGNIKKRFIVKNNYAEKYVTLFYSNGNLYQKGKENNNKKNGWWYTYDSIKSKIIEKEYFVDNRRYTYVKLDTKGKCKYYEIRPYIESNDDTIFVSKNDSIPIKFYKTKERLNIEKYFIKDVLFNNGDNYQGFFTIFPYTTQYLYVSNIYQSHRKIGLYYIEYQAMYDVSNPPCCCDSVFFDYSSRFIYIKE